MASRKFTMADVARLQKRGFKITGMEPRISAGRVFVSKPPTERQSDGKTLVFDNLKLFVGTNRDRTRHWSGRKAEKDILTYQIMAQKPHKHDRKVRITMTRYTTRLMDEDNLGASYKSCGDCIVQLGIIKDDSPEYVQFIARQVRVSKRKEQMVTVVIEPI